MSRTNVRDFCYPYVSAECAKSLAAPKTLTDEVIYVERQKPVRQCLVRDRMSRRAPLAKQDEARSQGVGQGVFAFGEPGAETRKLPIPRRREILSAVLYADAGIARKGDTQVRSVELLFYMDDAAEQGIMLLGGEQFVIARHLIPEPGQMGCLWEAEKGVHRRFPLIQLASPWPPRNDAAPLDTGTRRRCHGVRVLETSQATSSQRPREPAPQPMLPRR